MHAVRALDHLHSPALEPSERIGQRDQIGAIEPGRLADIVLHKNDDSSTWTPLVTPRGQVVVQARRGDQHPVRVGGEVVESEGRLAARDLPDARLKLGTMGAYLVRAVGDERGSGQCSKIPEAGVLDKRYQYTQ